jgi:hypothetical protein
MKIRRKKERLDWRKSIEGHPHQETVGEEMASLVPGRIRGPVYAAAAIFGLFQSDIDAESAGRQRCPKCTRHSFRWVGQQDKMSPNDSNWHGTNCGNETDEFGNTL